MTKLLEIKDQLIRFYSKYETYLYPIVKFAVALALFTVINTNIGFMEKISRFPVALLLALVCAILPTGAILWIGAIVVLADMYALSMEVALTALILFAILFFVYFRFAPKDGLTVVLTPLCFKLYSPYVMPVGSSLLRSAYSVIGVVCGTVVYYFLDGIHRNAGALMSASNADEEQSSSKFDISVGQFLGNKEMYLVIVIFVSYIVLGVTGKTLWLIVGNIISLLIAFILQFLFMNLDYARTERVQFEDDDYYYYVKAVPKKMVAVREVTVKHFGNTASMGKRIDHSRSVLSPEEEENSRKVIAKELDIDEDLLK